ncbi:TPA: hypothetical protein ACFNMI_001957 [Neisseria bacilliformis]|uniref:Uncharacterized protein n=1 Tax=Neisseria bacilliformis ATCC BAA-1200 TaxID=888742 RepID=F2BFE2_9NEIS|nr:hypothetical protein [Neisseria bacilliformis]EGF09014.1 hypothetical protein HMPREF9123_2449 [Neisseria bacilliformis ATCC BAA-1200]QMT47049.1 hypothetical protein H3L91_08960 [Neisseria bacilliformis]
MGDTLCNGFGMGKQSRGRLKTLKTGFSDGLLFQTYGARQCLFQTMGAG